MVSVVEDIVATALDRALLAGRYIRKREVNKKEVVRRKEFVVLRCSCIGRRRHMLKQEASFLFYLGRCEVQTSYR